MIGYVFGAAVVLLIAAFLYGPVKSPVFWGYGFRSPYAPPLSPNIGWWLQVAGFSTQIASSFFLVFAEDSQIRFGVIGLMLAIGLLMSGWLFSRLARAGTT
jgi:hypothetical protein